MSWMIRRGGKDYDRGEAPEALKSIDQRPGS